MQNRYRFALIVGVVASAVMLAGCSDDDKLEPETVAITATNYAFGGVPERVAAGSTLTLVNESDVELHEVVAMLIPEDVDLSVEELLQLPEEELDALVPPGPPAAVIVAPPGADGIAVEGDGVLAAPGRYALICAVPVGADPEAFMAAGEGGDGPPEVEGGPPHFVQGMFAELIVEPTE